MAIKKPKKNVEETNVDLSAEVLKQIVKEDKSQPGTKDRDYRK
jgi:hypothetical protein